MLRLLAMEEVQAQLGRVSALVRLFEAKDSVFVDEVKAWLGQAEELLRNNHLDGVSELAGLRLVLASAEQGAIPEFVHITGHPSRRKVKSVTAADVLQKGAKRVAGAISSTVTQVKEAERLIRQMLPVAGKKGLITETDGAARGDALAATWQAMEADTDLTSVAVHVCGLIGKQDALILLDRCLAWLAASETGVRQVRPLQIGDPSSPPGSPAPTT